jgi:hypothetical protein
VPASICYASVFSIRPDRPVLRTRRKGHSTASPKVRQNPNSSQNNRYGICCSSPTRPRVQASYPVLVHRHTLLLHASFRPRLATTPLRFANPSPPSGWIRDSHPQTVEHAQHAMTPGRTPGLEIASAIPTSASRRRRRSSNFPARSAGEERDGTTV